MKRAVLSVLLALLVRLAAASPEWQLRSDKDGIKIYTARQDNSSFKKIKVDLTADGTITELLAMLMDVDKHTEWVYNTKEARILKKTGEGDMVFYAVVNVPWPFANRDYAAHFKATQPSQGVLDMESHAVPDYLPVQKNLVRVQTSNAKWKITAINDHQIHIEYTIQFDPAGQIPAWLINLFVTDGPNQTFKKIRERLPAYQNVKFNSIKN